MDIKGNLEVKIWSNWVMEETEESCWNTDTLSKSVVIHLKIDNLVAFRYYWSFAVANLPQS